MLPYTYFLLLQFSLIDREAIEQLVDENLDGLDLTSVSRCNK